MTYDYYNRNRADDWSSRSSNVHYSSAEPYSYQDFSPDIHSSNYGRHAAHNQGSTTRYGNSELEYSGSYCNRGHSPRPTSSLHHSSGRGRAQSNYERPVQGQYMEEYRHPSPSVASYGSPPTCMAPSFGPSPPYNARSFGPPAYEDRSYDHSGASYGSSFSKKGEDIKGLRVNRGRLMHLSNVGRAGMIRNMKEEKSDFDDEDFDAAYEDPSDESRQIGTSKHSGPPPPYKKSNPEEIIWYDRERITGGPPRKLFIYDITPHTSKKTLKRVFGQYGKILRCEVLQNSKNERYGFVTYPAAYMASDAMKNEHHIVDGKEVTVKPERTASDNSNQSCLASPNRKLFVGGLRPETDNETLRKAFEPWGEIENVYIMRQVTSKRSRGFGYVEFKELSVANEVFNKKPHMVDGIQVVMQYANPENVRKLPKKSVKKLKKRLASKKGRGKLTKFQKAYIQSQETKGMFL